MTQPVMLGVYNRVDAAVLSSGSWAAALPLANLQNRVIGKVARSSDATAASTKFDMALDAARNIRCISLVNHNISLLGTTRIRGSNEASVTNSCLQTEVMGNASWTKTNITVATNSIAAPDTAVTADTITATSANATILQAITLTNAAYTFSVWLKRLTGTGNIQMTLDGGSTWTTKTVTTTWTRFQITQTLANPSVGVRIVTNADAVYMWGAQAEAGSAATSYYPATTVATVRAAGYMDAWQSYAIDTGWVDTWPTVYTTDTIAWEEDTFWTGQYSTEEITGYTTNQVTILATNTYARWWRVEISDTTNAAGYVQLGRVFIGSAFQPEFGIEVGMQLGWSTTTAMQRSLGGTKYFQRRTPYRTATFSLKVLTLDEGLANAFEIDRRSGLDAELLVIIDPDDTVHQLRRRFLGSLRELTPLEQPYSGDLSSKNYIIEELI